MKKSKEVIEKWKPIIENNPIKSNWMESYSQIYKSLEESPSPTIVEGTFSFGDCLLPIAMKLASKTMGMDLVSTTPIGVKDEKILEIAKIKVKAINRDRKINLILKDIKYVECKIEDTEEYKEYLKSSVTPSVNLMYLDFIYKG